MITSFQQLDLNIKYTYKDYLTWRLKERVELILGRIFKMSPASSPIHQEIVSSLNAAFYQLLKGYKCKVYPAPFDVRLDSDTTVVQPDICIICDLNKIDSKGCSGAPDLVVEVISPSTARKDLHEKYDLYERSGVKEYWVIHPHERTLSIFTLNDEGKYITSKPYTEGDIIKSEILKGFKLNLSNIFPEHISEPEEDYAKRI